MKNLKNIIKQVNKKKFKELNVMMGKMNICSGGKREKYMKRKKYYKYTKKIAKHNKELEKEEEVIGVKKKHTDEG